MAPHDGSTTGGNLKAYQARRLDYAVTFKLFQGQVGLKQVRRQLVGLTEDGERGPDPTAKKKKLLRLLDISPSVPHQLRGLLSE